MENNEDKRIVSFCKYAIVSIVSLLVGAIVMYIYFNNGNIKVISNNDKYGILDEVTKILEDNYYKDIDKDKLIDGAISGLVSSIGDKHTQYFTKEEAKSFKESLASSYYGIGAIIFKNSEGETTVKRVFDDSPAKKAGIQSGDIILKVDGKDTKDMNVEEVANTLKNSKAKTATILIRRNGEEKTFEITKSTVPLKSVSYEMLDNKI